MTGIIKGQNMWIERDGLEKNIVENVLNVKLKKKPTNQASKIHF